MAKHNVSNFEVAQEVTEDFGLSPEYSNTLDSEQNAGAAGLPQGMASSPIASHPLEDILPNVCIVEHELHRLTSSAVPKDDNTSGSMKSNSNSDIDSQMDELLTWEDTGAIPKYLTRDYAEKASRYLPPFKKPQPQKPKKNMPQIPSSQPLISGIKELHAELQDLQRAEARQELGEQLRLKTNVAEEFQRPDAHQERSSDSEVQREPVKERRSSRSEQAQYVRQHCLDFQDYKRTVNNKQKCLEQSLNLVLPKMNSAMVDAQNLASKIEKVRSQDCETEEALKIQNDKMKYLVGRTVGTISKIDTLFDRFRADILEYTTLTTDGNTGIDKRLSKLLSILCGVESKEEEKEENKLMRDSFDKTG